jgi:hypothetical protein
VKGLRLAGAAFALGLAAGAAGFVQSTAEGTGVPLSWPTNLVPFSVNPAQPHASPSCAAGPDGDPALDAVRASFAEWEQSCSSLELLDAGTVAEIRTGRRGSGENLVVFRQGWCSAHPEARDHVCMKDPDVDCGGIFNCFEDRPGDRSIVALTSVLYYPDTGRIVDADIEVNGWSGEGAGTSPDALAGAPHGWYFTCNGRTGEPCRNYGDGDCHYIDLQNTLTHEVGHFLGLRHVCDGGAGADAGLPSCDSDASYAAITMHPSTHPGDVDKRTLHPDDVAGVCAIYPLGRASAASSSRSSAGGCGTGGAGGALSALLAAAALARARRRG